MKLLTVYARKLKLDFHHLNVQFADCSVTKPSKRSCNPCFICDFEADFIKLQILNQNNEILLEYDRSTVHFIGKSLDSMKFNGPTLILEYSNGFYVPSTNTSDSICMLRKISSNGSINNAVSRENTAASTLEFNSLGLHLMLKILELETEIKATRESLEEQLKAAENAISIDNENTEIMTKIRIDSEQTKFIASQIAAVSAEIGRKKNYLSNRKRVLSKLKSELDVIKNNLNQDVSRLRNSRDGLVLSKSKLKISKSKIMQKQCQLITDILEIYPLNEKRIRGLHLPDSVFIRTDKEKIALALGSVASIVVVISKYLYLPLRYPIKLAAARSIIIDYIGKFEGSREFPLFQLGVEHIRFEYGVFLLNKDIEQLMNYLGISVYNLRKTLYNLKQIFDKIAQIQHNHDENDAFVTWNQFGYRLGVATPSISSY